MKRSFDVSRTAGADCGKAWRLLTDTRRWPEWGPSVRAVRCREPVITSGSRGKVLTAFRVWLPFEVTEWEQGRRWAWKVAGVTATGHRVEPGGKGRCRVVFEVPLLAAPYGLLCLVAANRIVRLLEGTGGVEGRGGNSPSPGGF